MTKQLDQMKGDALSQQKNVQLAIREALERPNRTVAACSHISPERYRAGQPLQIELSFEKTSKSARLYYRHVNQAERYETVEMQVMEKRGQVTIPGAYTDSQYPIQYYFELREDRGAASLYPGFNKDLTNQPYFVAHPG
jgi:hypothetical protein